MQASMESFFNSLKNERVFHEDYSSKQSTQSGVQSNI
jgi:hypothetical protein